MYIFILLVSCLKKLFKPTIGFFIIIFLAFALILEAGNVLAPEGSATAADAIDSFHTLAPDSLDVIVYGSSHAWKGCDTRVFEDKYGYRAYNYGCDWQALSTTLLFLQDSLRTQKPKYAFIETYLAEYILEDTNMDGQIYYTKHISDFSGKREYLSKCFAGNPERYASYYFPIIIFHDNWVNLTKDSFEENVSIDWRKTRGYYPSSEINPVEENAIKIPEQITLPDNSIETLDKMLSICKENGVTPIFYTSPWVGGNNKSVAFKEYAASRDVCYIDLYEHLYEMDFSYETDFRDHGGHLNDSGAQKVADYLGSVIDSQ